MTATSTAGGAQTAPGPYFAPRSLRTMLPAAAVLLLSASCWAPADVRGDVVASDYLGGGAEGLFEGATGWAFTPNKNITVTGLGVYDLRTPGFAEPHDVGIFR